MKQHQLSYLLLLIPLLLGSCATSRVYKEIEKETLKTIPSFSAPLEQEDVNGIFPANIYIKTRTQTFNSYYQFLLSEGKIYYKGLDGDEPEQWELMKKTGLPGKKFSPGFEKPREIVEISADGNQLVALSDDGRFYRIVFTPGVRYRAWTWLQKQGFPSSSPLYADQVILNNRGWSMGTRHKEVLW